MKLKRNRMISTLGLSVLFGSFGPTAIAPRMAPGWRRVPATREQRQP